MSSDDDEDLTHRVNGGVVNREMRTMGLDMYLKASKYVGGWRHSDEAEKKLFGKIAKAVGIKPCAGSPSFTIQATVGYWRKANAIHAWFVKNVMNGVDECQNSDVSRDQLKELRNKCKRVLNSIELKDGKINNGYTCTKDPVTGELVKEYNTEPGKVVAQPNVAAAILPTQSGFFFGSTDYDECYVEDLKDTVKIIDNALKMDEDWNFSYHPSW